MRHSHSPFQRARTAALIILLAGLAVGGYVGCHQATVPQKQVSSEELELCNRFMGLKNAHQPAADDLLGSAPVVPAEAVSPEETGRLQAEFFLRGDYRVVGVRPETDQISGPDARFVLALQGQVTSPHITQAGPDGTHVVNRSMSDPDVVVRVAGGKILATEARLHHDANEKTMSEEDQRQFRQEIEEQQRRLREFYQGTQRAGDKR